MKIEVTPFIQVYKNRFIKVYLIYGIIQKTFNLKKIVGLQSPIYNIFVPKTFFLKSFNFAPFPYGPLILDFCLEKNIHFYDFRFFNLSKKLCVDSVYKVYAIYRKIELSKVPVFYCLMKKFKSQNFYQHFFFTYFDQS